VMGAAEAPAAAWGDRGESNDAAVPHDHRIEEERGGRKDKKARSSVKEAKKKKSKHKRDSARGTIGESAAGEADEARGSPPLVAGSVQDHITNGAEPSISQGQPRDAVALAAAAVAVAAVNGAVRDTVVGEEKAVETAKQRRKRRRHSKSEALAVGGPALAAPCDALSPGSRTLKSGPEEGAAAVVESRKEKKKRKRKEKRKEEEKKKKRRESV
jgi:hypothetical protein